jgi:hypothetical protein
MLDMAADSVHVRDSQNKRSSRGKRYSLFASLAQMRMDLEKQILQDKSFQDQPLNSEIPHFRTFTIIRVTGPLRVLPFLCV